MAAYVLGCDTARVRVTMEEKASNPRGWSASPAASLCAAGHLPGRPDPARPVLDTCRRQLPEVRDPAQAVGLSASRLREK
jgi:hypothetical protein